MSIILKSPAKYVQGDNVLRQFDQYLQGMGDRLLILISENGVKRIKPALDACFSKTAYTLKYEVFSGECTRAKAERYAAAAKGSGITAVVGIGGGKIMDTAKAVAYYAGVPSIIVPTVASTDSPCSSLSVLYHDNGEFDAYLFLDNCPNMVLVDTTVILQAPVRFLVAGMGDALATYFEARACRASGRNNQVGALPTYTATELAALCWKYLQLNGIQAKADAEANNCSAAYENIVEVNTYLSGVGFESGGLAAAHAIQKGFTMIPELHHAQHGEKVAFCTLTQLVMEKAPQKELEAVLSFCCSVGLPVCFADLGYEPVDLARVRLAAEKACVSGSTIHNLPFAVTPDLVYEALLTADALGARYRAKQGDSDVHG